MNLWRRPSVKIVIACCLAVVSHPSFGKEVNLAPAATPKASYTSGDTNVHALNDGLIGKDSGDRDQGSYGNWPRRNVQWVQYEWPKAISTNKVEVYWWDDQRGVRAPESCRLLAWGGDQFVPVLEAQGLGVVRDKFNVTTFQGTKTTRLRLEITGTGDFSTGLLEWRVFDSGASPKFPPSVSAGVDRVVVLGGQTFLDANVQTLDGSDAMVRWSKASGPGEVQFADHSAASTTAKFDEVGDYTLNFTGEANGLSSESSLRVQVVSAPDRPALSPVTTGRYRVTSPLWRQRLKSLIVTWIPYCYEKISEPDLREGGINNFEEAAKKLAGEQAEAHRGYPFSNAWVYNTIESMCLAQLVDSEGDPEIESAQNKMREKLEEWIPKILASQEPDGYMQTAFTISGRQRWTHRLDHEGYVAGYMIDAALAHYLVTDRQDARLYQAARRLADCWCENIGPSPKRTWYNGHQAMEMSLVRLGQFVNAEEGEGKGDPYIELAKFLLDSREGGSEYDQSHVPVIKQYEAVGHAVRAVYSYAGMADVVLATGDRDYLSAVESLWDNLVHRKYYVTGGIGSGETSEGFGPDYSLRHGSYCESCSSCGELYFQHKLNRIRGEAKYADLYEETLYNALLGSMDLKGEKFYYQNPLDARGSRYAWHVCPCCVGNIPRTLLMLPTWMYTTSDDALHVNLYLGCETTVGKVAGTRVSIAQETDYPWDGQVKLKVSPEQSCRFRLCLRSPQRDISKLYRSTPAADGILELKVNGEKVTAPQDRGYVVIDHEWRQGDVVTFELPMKIQRVHASEKITATRDQVALRYGPLVYSLENIDQSLDKSLARDAALTTKWQPNLLGGVRTIQGKFTDGTHLLAVPNYARNNRFPDAAESEGSEASDSKQSVRSVVWIREAK